MQRVLVTLAVLCSCTGTVAPATAPAPTKSTPARSDWAGAAQGCSDFQVTVAHASGLRFIHIRGQRAPLGLHRVGDSARVSLGRDDRLQLTVDEYPAPGGQEHYCNDVVSSAAPTRSAELQAVAGEVTVRLTGLVDEQRFTLEMSLHGVAVRTPAGALETIADATFRDIRAGWLPG